MVWSPEFPDDFSQFQPGDILTFLDWFEREYKEALLLQVADAFVEGVTQPYLTAIAAGQPVPPWIESVLRWRLAGQWAYQRSFPLAARINRGMVALMPPEALGEIADLWRITPQDIADVPPAIRQAFLEGASFSLDWVQRLSDDARTFSRDILAVQALQNRNPLDAVPILEQVLRRDLVAAELGITPDQVTPEMIADWTSRAQGQVVNAVAVRAAAIARSESMRMINLGILSGLEQDGRELAYVMPHAGSCVDCRRLIDGRVFKIADLKANLFKNFGVKRQYWVASLPQHPNCRHSAMAVPVRFRSALEGVAIPATGIVLEWFGLPGGRDAMVALDLEKPEEGWLSPAGALV